MRATNTFFDVGSLNINARNGVCFDSQQRNCLSRSLNSCDLTLSSDLMNWSSELSTLYLIVLDAINFRFVDEWENKYTD
jgi:hypothetical protein